MDRKAKIYVDNLASGCNSVKHAEKYFVESRNILQSAGMNLCQWASNCPSVQKLAIKEKVLSGSEESVLGLI